MMDFENNPKYELLMSRSKEKMVNHESFKRQPQKIKDAMVEYPPYILYRLPARMNDYVMILSYNAHKDPHSKTPCDVVVYACTEDNPHLPKDYVMHRVPLSGLIRTNVHRAAAQIARRTKGHKA